MSDLTIPAGGKATAALHHFCGRAGAGDAIHLAFVPPGSALCVLALQEAVSRGAAVELILAPDQYCGLPGAEPVVRDQGDRVSFGVRLKQGVPDDWFEWRVEGFRFVDGAGADEAEARFQSWKHEA